MKPAQQISSQINLLLLGKLTQEISLAGNMYHKRLLAFRYKVRFYLVLENTQL